MAIFGEINPQVKKLDQLLAPRGPSTYSAGVKDGEKGIVRYAHPSSNHPNLMIVSPIYDDDGNAIMPGYYELILSEDRQILILAQSQNIIAKIPVFKVEEDRNQEQVAQPMDYKTQKKFDIAQKKKEKKSVKEGKTPNTEPEIYMNATIQYDNEGDYYLIKYERGKIRAWGAVK